jgi:DNA polymerase kappa
VSILGASDLADDWDIHLNMSGSRTPHDFLANDEFVMEGESSDSDCECASSEPASRSAPQYNGGVLSTECSAAKALLISASDKAGMQNIDRERINAILLRESGNSVFMQRQRKMDEKSDKKIRDMKRKLQEKDAAGGDWRKQLLQSTIDPMLLEYQSKRRQRSTCAVIDMDGFFISCHILSNPQLAEIPACVGGSSMISTSNYIARRYGVRAAMPGYLGSMLVKELSEGKETLTFVKSDFELYKKKSAEVKAVLEDYDPHLKMYSLDEAYMDIGPYLELKLSNGEMSHEEIKCTLLNKEAQNDDDNKHKFDIEHFHSAAQSLLHSIRQKVKDDTGLTCSAGLASNFLIAKGMCYYLYGCTVFET